LRYKKEIITGLKWTFSNSVVQAVLLAVQYLILARYLEPKDFGVMAILLVIVGIAAIFVEMGIGDAIVQSEELTEEVTSQLLMTSFLLGVIAILLTNIVGFFVLKFMGIEDHFMLLFLLTLTFLLSPNFYVYSALLEKNFLFAQLNKVTIFSFILGFISTIGIAVIGGGVLALVVGYIVIELSKAIGVYLSVGTIFTFKFTSLTSQVIPQMKYGSFISGSRLLNYMNGNFDKLIIGKFFGEDILGFYSVAWNIMAIPLRKINSIANNISFPVFSKLKSEPLELNKVFEAVMAFVVFVNVPVYLFLFFSGEHIVTLMFGQEWSTMGSILEWLSLLGVVKALSNPAGPLILAKGKSNIELYWNLLWLIVVLGVVYYTSSSNFEIQEVAKYLAISGLIFAPIWHYLVKKSTSVSYKKIYPLMIIVAVCFVLNNILNEFITGESLVLNTVFAIACGVSIWIYNEKSGFKIFSFLTGRNE